MTSIDSYRYRTSGPLERASVRPELALSHGLCAVLLVEQSQGGIDYPHYPMRVRVEWGSAPAAEVRDALRGAGFVFEGGVWMLDLLSVLSVEMREDAQEVIATLDRIEFALREGGLAVEWRFLVLGGGRNATPGLLAPYALPYGSYRARKSGLSLSEPEPVCDLCATCAGAIWVEGRGGFCPAHLPPDAAPGVRTFELS